MIMKSLSLIVEEPDSVKLADTKVSVFEVLGICAKKYDTASKGTHRAAVLELLVISTAILIFFFL
jgi:hypothetical protein